MVTSKSECEQHFGYLSDHSKDGEMPQDCLTCESMLECRLYKPRKVDGVCDRHRKTDLYTVDIRSTDRLETRAENHKLQHNAKTEQTILNAFQMLYARLRSYL